jgi:hypothetical protein
MKVSGQVLVSAALPPGVRARDIKWIGGWVDPRAGLDAVTKRKNPIIVPTGAVIQPVA